MLSSTTDILTIVFNFVEKHQLSSSARVCKAWREPALDQLWRELPSVFPLIELLGSLIYEDGNWTLRDGLERPNWDRWMYYASRTHCLTIDDTQTRGSTTSAIHQEIAIHLRSSFSNWGGVYLIPNLQKLCLVYSHPTTISLGLLFTNPPLKVLILSLKNPVRDVFTATRKVLMTLSAMHDTLKLQRIVIKCWNDQGHEAEFDSALANFLCSQPTISSLKLALFINVDTLKTILEAISQLKTLGLGLFLHPSDSELDAVSALVSKFHPKLEDFLFFTSVIPTGGLPAPRSLFECCDLKELTLGCIDVARLDHMTIEQMGKAWRHMEKLEMLPYLISYHARGISTAVLQHIAATFPPSLRQLAIPVAFEPGVILKLPTGAVRFPALQVLKVGHSIIPRTIVHQFVEFLSAITPLGFTIGHSHDANSDQGRIWNEVDDLIQMVQRIKSRTRSELLEERPGC